jgi:hypothetical protein
MIGLSVRVSGRPPVTMALSQGKGLVSAGGSWWKKRNSRSTTLFHGTGVDDRDDALEWFTIKQPARGTAIEIEVVETRTADWPRRRPRRAVDWRAHFRRQLARDRHTIGRLSARLRRGRVESSSVPESQSRRSPMLGFLVSLDSHRLGRVGVASPGSLDVTVYLKYTPNKVSVRLHAQGRENLGHDTWRSRRWNWSGQDLRVGQRIRIEVVEPIDLDLGETGEIDTRSPTSPDEIRNTLSALRTAIRTNQYKRRASDMVAWDRSRPAPRSYRRTPIRDL